MASSHLRANCLYTGISSEPNARKQVMWELYLLPFSITKRSTMSPRNLFLFGSKSQRSRPRVTSTVRRGSLYSCECWFLLVSHFAEARRLSHLRNGRLATCSKLLAMTRMRTVPRLLGMSPLFHWNFVEIFGVRKPCIIIWRFNCDPSFIHFWYNIGLWQTNKQTDTTTTAYTALA